MTPTPKVAWAWKNTNGNYWNEREWHPNRSQAKRYGSRYDAYFIWGQGNVSFVAGTLNGVVRLVRLVRKPRKKGRVVYSETQDVLRYEWAEPPIAGTMRVVLQGGGVVVAAMGKILEPTKMTCTLVFRERAK